MVSQHIVAAEYGCVVPSWLIQTAMHWRCRLTMVLCWFEMLNYTNIWTSLRRYHVDIYIDRMVWVNTEIKLWLQILVVYVSGYSEVRGKEKIGALADSVTVVDSPINWADIDAVKYHRFHTRAQNERHWHQTRSCQTWRFGTGAN